MSESFSIKLQVPRTVTLLKGDSNTGFSCETCEKTPCFSEHLQWLLLTVSGFQPATLLGDSGKEVFR